jgi:hypothetical protein
MWAFNMLSDSFVSLVLGVGWVVTALALLIMLEIVLLRIIWSREESRKRSSDLKWRPILSIALSGTVPKMPVLARHEQIAFLELWLHLQASVQGDGTKVLNDIAIQLGVDDIARRLLLRGGPQYRLLGIFVLGYLRDRQAWPSLLPLTALNNGNTSLRAFWALLQINGTIAMPLLLPLMLERDDWHIVDLAHVLHQERQNFSIVVGDMLPTLEPKKLARALHLMRALQVAPPVSALLALLQHQSPDILVPALRLAAWSGLDKEVRSRSGHAEWTVRAEVAKALAHIGTTSDLPLLVQLSSDSKWWVRYRAAEALAELPSIGGATIESIAQGWTDQFARETVARALIEKSVRCA